MKFSVRNLTGAARFAGYIEDRAILDREVRPGDLALVKNGWPFRPLIRVIDTYPVIHSPDLVSVVTRIGNWHGELEWLFAQPWTFSFRNCPYVWVIDGERVALKDSETRFEIIDA